MTTFGVTGASGFLGGAIARILTERGDVVVPLHHSKDSVVYPHVPVVDVLVHAGGGGGIAAADAEPAADLRAHAQSTLELLEAQKDGRFQRLVLISSAAVYGRVQGLVPETQTPRPLAAYGVSKRAAELYTQAYGDRYGLDVVVARVGNPYGPGQRKLVVYDLALRALQDGAPLVMRGNGSPVRDFLHVDDVARAVALVADRADAGGVLNLGSGQPVSIRDVALLVAEAAGIDARDVLGDGTPEGGKVNTFVPAVDGLQALGFVPKVALADGVAQTVAWVRDEVLPSLC